MRFYKPNSSAVLLLATVVTATYAQAANKATITQLDEITVHGHKQVLSNNLGSSTIDMHNMQQRSINNWMDFSKRGNASVNFNRQNNSVNVRGMDSDRVVTRLDGVPLPWINDGARGVQGGLNTISFDTLEEIIFLGNANANRSGSVTGGLDLRTLSPHNLITKDKKYGAIVHTGYDNADRSRSATATIFGHIGTTDTRWLLQAGTKHGNELKNMGEQGGHGPERTKTNPQRYKQSSLLLKLEHDINSNHRLEASGEYFRNTATIQNLRDQGPGTSFLKNKNIGKEIVKRNRLLLGYQYNGNDPLGIINNGYIRTWWQKVQLEGSQNAYRLSDARGNIIPGDPFLYKFPFGTYVRENTISESSNGLTTEWSGYAQQTALLHNWSVGGDWYRSQTKQSSSGLDNCPKTSPHMPAPFGPRTCDLLHTGQSDMPRVDGKHLALWAQDDVMWGEGRYSITPGLRFDSYEYTPKGDSNYSRNPNANINQLSKNQANRFSPSVKATFNPNDSISIYASYSYGFKAPNPSQLYLNYGAPGTYLNVGNPDLKPEISRGLEVGLVAETSKARGTLRLFHNKYRDFIDTAYQVKPGDNNWNNIWSGQYPMGVTMSVNRARVRIYGAELSGEWEINPNWYSRASIAWTRGKDTSTNRPLNTIAPLKTHLAAGYKQQSWGAEAQVTLAARRSRVETSDSDFKAPGYGITDLALWWTPPSVKGLKLQAGVYNMFNKKYWDALNVPNSGRGLAPVDYYTEPGRSFRLAVSYSF